jgi:hypothetical protein
MEDTMTQQVYGKSYGATPAENYQRFFVPSIGAPRAVGEPSHSSTVDEFSSSIT